MEEEKKKADKPDTSLIEQPTPFRYFLFFAAVSGSAWRRRSNMVVDTNNSRLDLAEVHRVPLRLPLLLCLVLTLRSWEGAQLCWIHMGTSDRGSKFPGSLSLRLIETPR